MTKEEILQKSRSENKNKDIYDLEIQNVAATTGFYTVPALCALVAVLQFVFTKTVSAGVWCIYSGMLSVTFLVKFVKMHKKHELFVFIGYSVIFVFLLVTFIFQLCGKI